MIKLLKQIYWFIMERCIYCGGELEVAWGDRKQFCKVCHKNNY